MKSQMKNKNSFAGLILAIVVALIGGGGYATSKMDVLPGQNQNPSASVETSQEENAADDQSVEEIIAEKIAEAHAAAEKTAAEDAAVEEKAAEDTAVEETATEDSSVEDVAAENVAVEDGALADGSLEAAEAEETPLVRTYRFRNQKLLNQHYEKHGIEMGFASAGEYEAAASRVITNPAALHKKESEDNDTVYYLESTNEFAVLSDDGFIRTYFYPSAGIKYYNRQ